MSARICGFMDDRFEKTFPRRYDRDLGNVRIVYLRSLSVDPWNINNYPMIKFLKFLIANYYSVSIILVLSYHRRRKDFSLTPFETSPSSSLHIFRVRSKRRKYLVQLELNFRIESSRDYTRGTSCTQITLPLRSTPSRSTIS